MKPLKCDMCDSTDVIKTDGLFVCQNCGTKYSIEEARRMMIEGTVDVSGSVVKLDQSEELSNLFELARRAKQNGNNEYAQKYYEQILLKKPSDPEAYFYSEYYRALNSNGIQVTLNSLSNCLNSVLQSLSSSVSNPNEVFSMLSEMRIKTSEISRKLFNDTVNLYYQLRIGDQGNYITDMRNNCRATRDIMYTFGDRIIDFFGAKYGDLAASCWEDGVRLHTELLPYLRLIDRPSNKATINEYIEKIQVYHPAFNKGTLRKSWLGNQK